MLCTSGCLLHYETCFTSTEPPHLVVLEIGSELIHIGGHVIEGLLAGEDEVEVVECRKKALMVCSIRVTGYNNVDKLAQTEEI